jgi:hypothetical protein
MERFGRITILAAKALLFGSPTLDAFEAEALVAAF